ncbi:MAG: hypothetical protein V9F01_04635 [Chitinophagaceae bacterium]
MKIAPLLAQYLYTHKRLDLPGLGSFLLDPSVILESESSKQGKSVNLEGVTFESNTSLKNSPELVEFISSQTGKIKALAAADLQSHLGLAEQFLNIGKPFLFEGIGTLTKIKSGEFSFTSGQAIPATTKDLPAREAVSAGYNETDNDYKSIFYARKIKMTWKRPVVLLLVLAGLALAIWGGYTVYKKTMAKKESSSAEEKLKGENVPVTDTATRIKDSRIKQQIISVPAGNYKFVLETSDSLRAFTRFKRLKTFQWNVQMETKDSLSFKIFMLLPATATDTSRILDSLSRLNGRRVYIE